MGKPYRRKDSPYWWIAPMIDGVQRPRSSETTDYKDALDALRKLEGEIAKGVPITHKTGRCKFSDLAEDLKRNYAIMKRRSESDLIRRLDLHLVPFFGGYTLAKITTSLISEYIQERQKAKAKNATINRELAAMKRAFTLAIRSGKAVYRPHIEMLPEDNIREGFFDEVHYNAVIAKADPLLASILKVAHVTGWRIRSILRLEWRAVDLEAGRVSLQAVQTKNRKAVTFPLKWGLKEVFEERRRLTDETQRTKAEIIPWVFHRDGKPVRSIRGAWVAARTAAKVPGRLLHDFRRTSVRNLLNAGVPLPDIMNMVGFKTLSILMRYSITSDADVARAGDLMDKKGQK